MARSTGKVRPARFTDLAALGELSRLAQADGDGTRSLGLPVTGPRIGIFSNSKYSGLTIRIEAVGIDADSGSASPS
jgi:hypothetical protein